MKFFIVLSALVAAAMAKPGYVSGLTGYSSVISPLVYARVGPGAQIGSDGRVIDTPEVAAAKIANAAAHINEKVTLANEAAKNYRAYSTYAASPFLSAYSAPAHAYGKLYSGISPVASAYSAYGYGIPFGYDGRVFYTPPTARSEHLAAHAEARAQHLAAHAEARAVHFAAHADANARTAYAGNYRYAAPSVSV